MKKKSKVLAAAIALMTLSTAASITGTVAWFSANQIVTAQGMSVNAQAEEGIVISNATSGPYNVSANAADATVKALKPASTWNCADWYHSVSTDPSLANTTQQYTEITSGIASEHYVKHDFYIRSSAASVLTVASLNVQQVTASVNGSGELQELSKSLRVGVVFDADTAKTAYLYAPITGYTASYSVHQSSDATTAHTKAVTPLAGTTVSQCSGVTTIPNNVTVGTKASVFIWFEGEDAACKSDNIVASLQQLDVTVSFSYTANA